jgi:hypothetical protein
MSLPCVTTWKSKLPTDLTLPSTEQRCLACEVDSSEVASLEGGREKAGTATKDSDAPSVEKFAWTMWLDQDQGSTTTMLCLVQRLPSAKDAGR